MPPIASSAATPARGSRAGAGRQLLLACLFLGLFLPIVAVTGTWGLPIWRTVHVSADGRTVTHTTFRRTVRDVLAASRITLRPDDRITPAPQTLLWPGIQISVVRALPVTLTVGGVATRRRVAAQTVGEALRMLGVGVGPLDRVYPDPRTALDQTGRITVERRRWRTWVQQAPVAFSSSVVTDPELFKGNTRLRSLGQPGLRQRAIRALYANGRPVAVSPLGWTMVRAPIPHVIAVGTRAMIASRGPFTGREYLTLEATAYYPGPNNYGGGVGPRTAIGMLAQRGVAAVDPAVIPLGTRLYIEGYGYAVAGDTGSAIQGMRIDLCYNTYDEAVRFGRQTVTVYILGK